MTSGCSRTSSSASAGNPILVAVGAAIQDLEVAAFCIAEILQTLQKLTAGKVCMIVLSQW